MNKFSYSCRFCFYNVSAVYLVLFYCLLCSRLDIPEKKIDARGRLQDTLWTS